MSDTNHPSGKSSLGVPTSEETTPGQPNTLSLVPPQQEPNGNGLLLLDGASSQMPIVAPELETQRRVAADTSRPLPERLEAYEDIMDSEVAQFR